uniref:HAD-IC family P-type ATPase n=1 Tax=Desertifilum tharense IPPAS B-1220 TaxID=1781255 RepID=A0ACD5GZ39_9CYAN
MTLDFVTGIRVSIPTAFLGALSHTTRHGVLVRAYRTLEQLAEVDTIVFDKTGTLTQGTIAIAGVQTVEAGLSAQRILQLAAAAEQRLNHPVAEAIVEHVKAQNLEIPVRGEWTYEVGLGVRAQVEGIEVLVGSERFLQQAGVEWGDGRATEADCWQSLIYVACDRHFQGAIQYRDPLRPESRNLIGALQRDYGIELHLLTGDRAQRAAQVLKNSEFPPSRLCRGVPGAKGEGGTGFASRRTHGGVCGGWLE